MGLLRKFLHWLDTHRQVGDIYKAKSSWTYTDKDRNRFEMVDQDLWLDDLNLPPRLYRALWAACNDSGRRLDSYDSYPRKESDPDGWVAWHAIAYKNATKRTEAARLSDPMFFDLVVSNVKMLNLIFPESGQLWRSKKIPANLKQLNTKIKRANNNGWYKTKRYDRQHKYHKELSVVASQAIILSYDQDGELRKRAPSKKNLNGAAYAAWWSIKLVKSRGVAIKHSSWWNGEEANMQIFWEVFNWGVKEQEENGNHL